MNIQTEVVFSTPLYWNKATCSKFTITKHFLKLNFWCQHLHIFNWFYFYLGRRAPKVCLKSKSENCLFARKNNNILKNGQVLSVWIQTPYACTSKSTIQFWKSTIQFWYSLPQLIWTFSTTKKMFVFIKLFLTLQI